MKRSNIQRKTTMPRTGKPAKPRKRMARVSQSNSRPGENVPLRNSYMASHPRCLLECGRMSLEAHHIRRGSGFRHDVVANLAALCHECHMEGVHSSKSQYAAMTIEVLYRKLLINEFDPVALDAIGTPLIAGWLDRHRPGAANAELCHQWFRLSEECKRVRVA